VAELQNVLSAAAHSTPATEAITPASEEQQAGSETPATMDDHALPTSSAPGKESEAPNFSAEAASTAKPSAMEEGTEPTFGMEDETVFSYFKDHADDIAAEGDKPFQAIGGMVDLLSPEHFPATESAEASAAEAHAAPLASTPHPAAAPHPPKAPPGPPKRENTLQKINSLDVKGRIQLALKGNKEERSILIRDGTKVVALAVLEAPKLSDGEVEKFASQKNVLEAVLRQIPLKRRFMKNYIVVRNLVANPRTPLDLGLGLMKNLLVADLKNLSSNKEVSETIRKLAMKMYKQKLDAANKK
jgi:hypothetical protein